MPKDLYVITEETIKEPPATLLGKFKFLGPGFILSASIVGSGELIATTTLGARAGFIAFWIIILSCLVKVAVQLEFGKHAILTGETAMTAFNKLPGPKFGKSNWSVWAIFLLVSLKIVQLGGIVGGTAIVLNMIYSGFSITAWTLITAFVAAILIFRGYYKIVEKSSLLMIVGFTITTIVAVSMLRFTPYSFTWSDIWTGLEFRLPRELVAVAFGAFGITGVGADEILAYNYWCLEKGYAAYTGPRKDTPEWKNRAQGWIRVMYLDAFVAMVIYTSVTAAFYLLGAAVLHNRGAVPEGNDVIETLALIYTQTLGTGAKMIYLVGAFFVLFSSVFATLAAWTRLFPDIFGQLRWVDFSDPARRKKLIALLSWILPFVWGLIFLFIKMPVFMILSGGLIGSVILFIVVFAALNFKNYRQKFLPSGILYNMLFWISVACILAVGIYGIVKLSS